MLQRQTLRPDGIYLCYDAQEVYIFVGRAANPNLLFQLFKTGNFAEIDTVAVTEEEIFRDVAESAYLTSLYSIINQVRYQRQPFCALRVLLEGQPESERILAQLCVLDNSRTAPYQKEYAKFMSELTPPVQSHLSQHGGGVAGGNMRAQQFPQQT